MYYLTTLRNVDGLVLNITTAGHDLDSMAGKNVSTWIIKRSW